MSLAPSIVRELKQQKPAAEPNYPLNVIPNGLHRSAKTVVTDGHPEEMNEMPADLDPLDEDPTYDGSSE